MFGQSNTHWIMKMMNLPNNYGAEMKKCKKSVTHVCNMSVFLCLMLAMWCVHSANPTHNRLQHKEQQFVGTSLAINGQETHHISAVL